MRVHPKLILLVMVGLLVIAACQTAPLPTATPASTATVPPPTATTAPTPPPAVTATLTPTPPPTTTLSLYFFRDGKLGVVHRKLEQTRQIGTVALQALLAGPTAAEQALGFRSAIPTGTQLHTLTINGDQATADLSGAFTTEATASLLKQRVAEVVFTLTQFPTIHSVLITVDGVPIEPQAAGLRSNAPFTRAVFEDLLPAIFVESPAPGDTVSTPLRIWGTANVFEATFHLSITDTRGTVLADQPVTATSGSGTRGTFEVTVQLPLQKPTPVNVIVFELSPRDGSPTNRVEIPITVAP
jgi:hypothetical protein